MLRGAQNPLWFYRLAEVIEQAQELEREAGGVAARADEADTGWMPFNLFDFAALLFESIPLIPQETPSILPWFLDIGAGPGSKMMIARDVFGMETHGIEALGAVAKLSSRHGLDVEIADARVWSGYSRASAVWLNRPIRNRTEQRLLEERVYREKAPGAVLICANTETRPPDSWFIVNDSWDDLRRGSWVKPAGPDTSE
jgi:hypothetical protein